MKIGRNDPCPCGSGRKYKHCCLNKKTFEQVAQAEPMPDMPPIHILAGFDSETEYKKAMEQYTEYCENKLKPGEMAPSFREYTFGASPASSVFDQIKGYVELAGAGSMEELKATMGKVVDEYNEIIDEEDPDHWNRIDSLIKELVYEGVFKAENAVEVKRTGIRKEELENTLLIKLSQTYIEYIVRNNGKQFISVEKKNSGDIEAVFELYKELFKEDASLSTGFDGIHSLLWYLLVKIVLLEKGYFEVRNNRVYAAEKGLNLLNGKDIKKTYFAFFKYITEKINWFFFLELPEDVEIIQDAHGLFMYTMHMLEEGGYKLDSETVFKTVDSILKMEIDEETAVGVLEDFFIKGFLHLAGFTVPAETGAYKMTELFNKMFIWKI